MKIHELYTKDLIPYDNNPRINDQAVDNLVNSIKEFGFKVPIVIDKNFIIAAGHTRLKAAQQLGIEKVPCIIAEDLTEEQIKAFRLADNKVSESAMWDPEKLEIELLELQDLDFDMNEFGFDVDNFEIIDDNFDLEEAIENIEIPKTKPGDIYQLGRHRLMCGDSTLSKDMKQLMDGYHAHLIITDPPYNVNYEGGNGKTIMNDHMEDGNFRNFLFAAYQQMYENIVLGGPIYVFHADSEGYNFRGAFKDAGFKLAQCLVWVKNSLVLGRQDYHWRHEPILYGWKEGEAHRWFGNRDKDTVIDESVINFTKMKKPELVEMLKEIQNDKHELNTVIYHDKPHSNSEHPTMKPVELIAKLVKNSSECGDLILDSFGGGGSTLMACEQTNRTANLMELDPKYCDVIVKRWEEYTEQKAELINGKV